MAERPTVYESSILSKALFSPLLFNNDVTSGTIKNHWHVRQNVSLPFLFIKLLLLPLSSEDVTTTSSIEHKWCGRQTIYNLCPLSWLFLFTFVLNMPSPPIPSKKSTAHKKNFSTYHLLFHFFLLLFSLDDSITTTFIKYHWCVIHMFSVTCILPHLLLFLFLLNEFISPYPLNTIIFMYPPP